MLFAIKQKNTIKSLRIWNITIKSKVYSYKDFYSFLNLDNKFILSCSAFQISKGRKEQEIFYVKEFQDIQFLYTSFIKNKNKEIFLNYIKWRLAVLGRLLKTYNIEEINIKQFYHFLFIEADLEIIQKLSCLFKYKESYNLQDLKDFYKSCCEYKKQDNTLLTYLASIYKISLSKNIKKIKEDEINNITINQVVKILAKQFDLPETIVRTYKKSLQKWKDFLNHKNIKKVEEIEKLIKKHKWKDVIETIENLIRNKKTEKSNFLDISSSMWGFTYKVNKIKI